MAKPVAVIKTYYSEADFTTLVKNAEKVGIRRTGLFLYVKKKGSFNSEEVIPNTKGLAKFTKFCIQYWREHEIDRLEEQMRIAEEEKELIKRKKKLGMIE